jgi:DNA-directed RNA polymerase specialized sigma24 family protein
VIRAGLERLARDQPELFECLRRFVLEGQPQAEIARAMGISPGAVKKRVFRGKRLLASYLREEVWHYACSPAEYEAELAYLAGLLGDPSLAPT